MEPNQKEPFYIINDGGCRGTGFPRINMNLKSDKPLALVEVKNILTEREKQGELGYEQKITLDYLKKFAKTAPTKVNKAIEELKALEKLNERQITNVVNLLPQDLDDIRVIFSNERVELTPADKQKILDIVKELL